MHSRNFTVFGGLAAVGSLALFLVLTSSTTWSWYWSWLLAAGIVAFAIYGYDKVSAKAGAGRVPEALLHLLALAGGFAGALLGMLAFRHKTNFRAHPLFLPLIILGGVLWGAIIYWIQFR